MNITNQFITPSFRPSSYEKTDDGFLRVKARVLAERIMPYARQELSSIPESCTEDVINMLVTCDSMRVADACRSLEGAQVVAPDHIWVTPDNAGVSKGNTAGAAHLDGPYLVIDMIITDPTTIADIESGKIGEISAGYHADTIFESGEFDGQLYQAKQTQLRFNHIAIIPSGAGRAGTDVRIINKKQEEKKMDVVKVRLRNGKFINTDEEGAAAIEEDSTTAEVTASKSLEDLMTQVAELNSQIEALQAEAEEGKGELSVYKEKLDELLSDEAVEHAAEELTSERGEGMEILENAFGEEEADEKEKVKNSIKGLRGTALHTAVLTACGVKVENMSSEAIRGAFKAQGQLTRSGFTNRKHVGVTGAKLMNSMTPNQTSGNGGVQRTALERLGFKK